MKSVVVDGGATTGRATSRSGARSATRSSTRRTSPGFTADPSSGVARRAARHVRGLHREDPVPASTSGSPPSSCCRSSQFDRAGGPGRPGQLLGLPAGLVLRAARGVRQRGRARRPPWTSSATWSRRSTGPASRSSSTSSTTTPPKAARTARRSASAGLANDDLLHARRDDGGYLDYSGMRQHVQRQPPDRPAADRRQPPLLGRGDARRRLPVRPGGGPVARRGRRADAEPAGAVGHRDRPGRWPARSSSPRRGTPAACTRSAASSAIAGSEWNGRFRDDVRAFVKRRPGHGAAPSASASSAARTSTATSTASPRPASTSSPATTASRSTTWSRTTRSTTRPTARTTATAATRT